MNQLETIISKIAGGAISQESGKRELQNLMLQLAETHSMDGENINLSSFVGEVAAL